MIKDLQTHPDSLSKHLSDPRALETLSVLLGADVKLGEDGDEPMDADARTPSVPEPPKPKPAEPVPELSEEERAERERKAQALAEKELGCVRAARSGDGGQA